MPLDLAARLIQGRDRGGVEFEARCLDQVAQLL
jgi:hypothetical protein